MALLKFKRSATPSKVPTTSDLALGELALNTYDGKVYMKKDDGTQAIVEVGGTSGGGTVTSVAATAGTGISVSGSPITTSGTLTITNTAPDQTVTLTQAGTTTITGTYPNFTISSADQYDGTVTSVSGTGTVNGLTLSGTVTSSGSLTLGGTLAINNSDWSGTDLSVANGGTGASTAAGALANLGAQAAATALTTSTTFSGDVSGTYNAIVVADDSHNHVISNVDGLQTALDGKVDLSGDTMSGDLIISKADARLKLYDSTGTSGNNPYVEWETTANQGIAMELNVYDGELPVSGYGLVVREGPSNGQFPTTGTLTFNVLGEMYAGGTSLGSLNKVFHDGYHPNADKWTTARTLSLTGDVTGSVSWDGSGNASLSATLGSELTPLRATELSSSVDLDTLVAADAGFYYQTANADTTGNNYPSGEAGSLIVQKSAGNATQLYQTYNSSSPKMFFRANYTTGYGSWQRVFADDYHPNADKLTTARTISLTGDVSGSTSFDGSANVSITATVADDSHNHIYDNIDGLTTNGWGGPRITTASGYIDFGPANASYAHIYTDRPSFYFNVDSSSNIAYGRASVRAPIFYDSDNTAYYVDPNSVTNIWQLKAKGRYNSDTGGSAIYMGDGVSTSDGLWINFHTDADTAYRIGKPAGAWTQPLELRFYTGIYHRAHQGYGGHRFYNYSGNSLRFSVADGDGDVRSLGNFRAPLMYDINNTAYYADLGSTGSSIRTAGPVSVGTTSSAVQLTVAGAAGVDGIDLQVDTTNSVNSGRMFWTNGTAGQGVAIYNGSGNMYLTTGATPNSTSGGTRMAIYSGNYVTASGSFRAPIFYDSNNTGRYADLSSTGDSIRASGDIVAYYSDDRLKDRGDNIANALDKVQSLNGFHYTANETAQKFGYKANPQVGVSAQEVEAVLPEVVKDAAIGHGYKTVDYAKLVPLLIEAIKELKAEVETLKKG